MEGKEISRIPRKNGNKARIHQSESVLEILESYIDRLKEDLGERQKSRIDDILFYFFGHGVQLHGEDCIIDKNGSLVTVKSIVKLIDKSGLIAENYFLIFDCCRNPLPFEKPFNKEHNADFIQKQDMNITKVFATQPGLTTPDVADKTITSTIVEFLNEGRKVEVQFLEKELRDIWDKKQKIPLHTPKVEFTSRKENTLFP